MAKNKLAFCLADNFRVGYFYYLPLSCILAHEDYLDWYYMNYVDIIGIVKEVNLFGKLNYKHTLRFTDSDTYISRRISSNSIIMVDEYDLDLVELKNDIVDFIKRSIDLQKYVIPYMNMARLEDINSSDTWIHEMLIYGYDDEKELLNCCYMIDKVYKEMQVSYEAVRRGFDDYVNYSFGSDERRKMLFTFQLTNSGVALDVNDNYCFVKPQYDDSIFRHKLYCYINGKVSAGELTSLDSIKTKEIYSGIDTYKVFEHYLKEWIKDENDGYTVPNFMFPYYYANHKQGIYDRLTYAYKQTGLKEYKKAAERYLEVVKNMDILKMLHVKIAMTQNILTEKQYQKIVKLLEETREREYSILGNLFK